MRSTHTFLLLIAVWLAFIGQHETTAAADVEAGHELAKEHCRRCHVIPGLKNMGIGSTPSFNIMIKSPAADWRDKFEAFFSLPPHPNFIRIKEYRAVQKAPSVIVPIVLGLDDIEDLMAYIDNMAKDLRKE